jgi:LuxR family maltose regulon positive regulatory protein
MEDEGRVSTPAKAPSYIIKRPRLTKLLDESEARIILLVAPAGYGKTTLAREWLEGKPGVAWYSGRPAMADVAALAWGLVSALATGPEHDRIIERLKIFASRDQSPEAMATVVLAAVGPATNTLVIDDCHHTAGSPGADALLEEVSLHSSLRIVLITRIRPAWVKARMLIYGDVRVLEREVLAFTDDEALSVIGDAGSEPTNSLLAQARGWPAVIGLAARQGGSDLDDRLGPGELYDFFAEDLFRRAEPNVQRALIALALGGDASPEVASALFGQDCDIALSSAADHGFLGPQGALNDLHPLLRAFLLQRLHQLPRGEAEALARETVAVLKMHERWDECLSALQAFPLSDLIVDVVRTALDQLLRAGRVATVNEWVQLAHSNQVDDPILLLAEAEVAWRDRDDAKAQVLGEQAGERLVDGDSAARGFIVAARAALFRDDTEAVRRNTERAYSAAKSVALKSTALWIDFSMATERSLEQSHEILEKLRQLPDHTPDHAVRLLNAHSFVLINTGGDVRLAAENSKLAQVHLAQMFDPLLTTNALNLYGYTMVTLAEYEEALSLAAALLEEARSSGLGFAIDHALLIRAAALIGLRKLSAAQRTLGEIADRANQSSAHILGNGELQKVKLAIAAGDLARAARLVDQEPPNSLSGSFSAEFVAHRGLVLAANGAIPEAKMAFDAALMEKGYAPAQLVRDLGEAIISLQMQEPESEIQCVEVIMRGFQQGQLDSIVTAGRTFPDLIRAGATDASCARGLTRLLSASSDVDLGRRAGLEMPRVLRRSEPLSTREREVCELVAQGRSNKEIAGTLFISESTTKVHLRHIFEKLGVHSRAEAVRVWSEDRYD